MFKKIIKFIPVIFWMSIIFYFSSRQTTGIGTNETDRFLILKSFHLIEYAILSFLLLYSIAYLYAVSDEIHQYFIPGRTGRFRDTLIDLIGILIGIFIFNKIFSFKKKKYPLY